MRERQGAVREKKALFASSGMLFLKAIDGL